MKLIGTPCLVDFVAYPSGNAEVLITQQAQRIRDGVTPSLSDAGNKQAAVALHTTGNPVPLLVQVIEDEASTVAALLDNLINNEVDESLRDAYRAQL